MAKITIDSTIESKLQEWLSAGRGIKSWSNLEIASGAAQQVFTPADVESAPNWRYGNPEILQPSDLLVETFEVLESFRGRFKAMYWGPWVADATEKKAQRLCAKHNQPSDSWRWQYDDPGYVVIEIGRKSTRPFGGAQ